MSAKDINKKSSTLLRDKHAQYIASFEKNKESFEFYATEHFRMSGVYWGLTAMQLLGKLDLMDKDAILAWVLSCQREDGGFGGSERHDSHLLYTLSAIQILALYGALDRIHADRTLSCELYRAALSQELLLSNRGSAMYFKTCLPASSALLIVGSAVFMQMSRVSNKLMAPLQETAGERLTQGGGPTPFLHCSVLSIPPSGNESHAGQVFCCVAALHLADALDRLDRDLTCWWLCERQTKSGGLNGRPEKLQDVCYSWWCLSALSILDRLHWIDCDALSSFILQCQDEERGGISDRPEDMVDVFHTFFGIAGLSLMGLCDLEPIDPTYALPVSTVHSLRGS